MSMLRASQFLTPLANNSLSFVRPDATLVDFARGFRWHNLDVEGVFELAYGAFDLVHHLFRGIKVLDDDGMRWRCRIRLEIDSDGIVEDCLVDAMDNRVVGLADVEPGLWLASDVSVIPIRAYPFSPVT